MCLVIWSLPVHSQRLRDQESRYEELTECKIQALMKSVKKCNKRMRCEEDPDEEYVSSVFLFREQQKVEVGFFLTDVYVLHLDITEFWQKS